MQATNKMCHYCSIHFSESTSARSETTFAQFETTSTHIKYHSFNYNIQINCLPKKGITILRKNKD